MRSIATDFRSGSRWPRSWTRPCWESNGRTADDDRVCAPHIATSIAIKVDLCPYPTGYHSSRIALIQTLLFLEEEDEGYCHPEQSGWIEQAGECARRETGRRIRLGRRSSATAIPRPRPCPGNKDGWPWCVSASASCMCRQPGAMQTDGYGVAQWHSGHRRPSKSAGLHTRDRTDVHPNLSARGNQVQEESTVQTTICTAVVFHRLKT